MFTKKSFVICLVMLLTLVGVGTVSTFASSVRSSRIKKVYPLVYNGIAAIPRTHKGLVGLQAVKNYLGGSHFIGGSTLSADSPTIENLRLTDITNLNRLTDIVIPEAGLVIPNVAGAREIYYTQIEGPFVLDHDLPLPALSTLFPSATNLPVFSHMSDLTGSLPVLDDLSGVSNAGGLLNLVGQGDKQQLRNASTFTVLQTLYEVFDATNGNLLAWG